MSRLPTPGGDDGTWGDILNDFLGKEHNPDGTLKSVARPSDVAAKYTKPGTGIPTSDLAFDPATQAELDAHATSSAPHSSTGDLALASDSDASGVGDLIFKTGGVERARIASGGTGSGLLSSLNTDGTLKAAAVEAALGGSLTVNSEDWYGEWLTIGNAPGSVGFAGTPTAAPATTVGSGGVTLPLTNGTVPVADCSVLSANGGSFTLGGNVIVYSGRSAASGAGNATGCYTLGTASGTYASGTALGFTSIGFGALAIYEKFGDATGGSNRPIPGTTQAGFLLANYYGPTVDDAMEGFAVFVGAKDTVTGFAQHKQITAFEAIAQIEGNNTLLDGDTTPLAASCARTQVNDTAHAKTVSGFRLTHNSVGSTFGFTDKYLGLWQPVSALVAYTTLNGAVTLPQATIAVASGAAMPPATAANPVTVKIGANADGFGGQLVTYTGISSNDLTGCTGGSGTIATGSSVTNDVASVNAKDRITVKAGLEIGDTAFSANISAALRGGTDGISSMFAITGPTNAEITGGLTLVRLNAGSGQTKSILQAFDPSGNNRLSISAACALILNGVGVVMQSSGVTSGLINANGSIQPGTSIAAGAGATAPGAKIYSGTGAPAIIGVLGDIFIRTDGAVGSTLYRCTTAGAAGVAVWTAIL